MMIPKLLQEIIKLTKNLAQTVKLIATTIN
jgi:hypothetical protein